MHLPRNVKLAWRGNQPLLSVARNGGTRRRGRAGWERLPANLSLTRAREILTAKTPSSAIRRLNERGQARRGWKRDASASSQAGTVDPFRLQLAIKSLPETLHAGTHSHSASACLKPTLPVPLQLCRAAKVFCREAALGGSQRGVHSHFERRTKREIDC